MTLSFVSSNGAKLATYSTGSGPAIIFLHGGPGDTHHYMKKMAEPLTQDFQCIFFDQRGTGQSTVETREQSSFKLDLMIEDITAIQKHYQTGPCMLVGHSWGALYGLFAFMKNPNDFTKAALLNMGPLDSEAGEKTAAHLLEVLNEDEKLAWKTLRQSRNEARDQGDTNMVLSCDKEMMYLRVKSWIYDPTLHEIFLADYFQYPPPDRDVNKWVWDSLGDWFSWENVKTNSNRTWLCAGANDATPVSQAERLASLLPDAELTVYDKCGHIPWVEKTEQFYADLMGFLRPINVLNE